MAKRGSRRAAAEAQRSRQSSKRAPERAGWRLWLRRLVLWCGGAAVLGALMTLPFALPGPGMPPRSSLSDSLPARLVVRDSTAPPPTR